MGSSDMNHTASLYLKCEFNVEVQVRLLVRQDPLEYHRNVKMPNNHKETQNDKNDPAVLFVVWVSCS